MKQRPILFSAPMVRAILDGRKTQTRRVVRPQGPMQPECWEHCTVRHGDGHSGVGFYAWDSEYGEEGSHLLKCPYGAPGDRLWVRETFAGDEINGFVYREEHPDADLRAGELDDGEQTIRRWRPSIRMPRRASRITLEVVSVRVERLNEISPRDCQLEGIDGEFQGWPIAGLVHEFAALWDSINGKSRPWASNPWVWVVGFKKLEVPK